MLLGQSIQDMAVYEWGVILRTIGKLWLRREQLDKPVHRRTRWRTAIGMAVARFLLRHRFSEGLVRRRCRPADNDQKDVENKQSDGDIVPQRRKG